jgi:hypothetical protein
MGDAVNALDTMLSAGITYRQLDYWCRQGWLKPTLVLDDGTHAPAGEFGSGVPRRWPWSEITVALLMRRLIAAGFTPAAAAVTARRVVDRDDVTVSGDLRLAELAPGVWIGVSH